MTKQSRRSRNRGASFNANKPLDRTVTATVMQMISASQSPGLKLRYLKEVWLSKYVSEDTDPASVRRQRAINKWLATERENEATNDRLITLEGSYQILPRVGWSCFVSRVRRRIAHLLGETVPLKAILGSFSGGASVTKSRTESHPALKYLGQAGITPAARFLFELVLDEYPLWKAEFLRDDFCQIDKTRPLTQLVEFQGNILFTVPKTTEIDRVAAKEPDLNMYLQKGVGNYIRRKLKTRGIDLNDQSINQRLARIGSIDGSLATIDLSSASDSMTTGIVELLLPEHWYALLADLRSPYTSIDGEWHYNHMFSSMGNGFTFELESLIFWALAQEVCEMLGFDGTVSVYGDDIIIPTGAYTAFAHVMSVCGFTVNSEKSFFEGPFRESCGGYYHNGIDITPFYLKSPLKTIGDAIKLANHIREWSVIPGVGILSLELEAVWLYLQSLIPRSLWGNRNTEDHSSLVSDDMPKKHLKAVAITRDTGFGGYLLWHDSCGTEPSATTVSSWEVESSTFRLRPSTAEKRPLTHIFLSEMYRGYRDHLT